MNSRTLILTLCALSALPLHADCIDGSRETTEAEKQFYIETMNAFKAALPPAPAGWRLEDRTNISAPNSVCTGSGKMPLRASYEVRYYWLDGIAELDKKNAEYRKRIADLKVLPADKQKEYDETSRRSRDLDRQARKLMATDKTEAEKLAAESKQLTNQAHEIRQAHLRAIGPQIDAISKEQFAETGEVNVEIKLKISSNSFNLSMPEGGQKGTTQGATLAVRSPKQTVFAYGKWTPQGNQFKPVYTPGATTRVQNIAIEASGDAKHVEPLLSTLNSGALTSMLGQ
ncbi:MAG TPA: hypothetical protein VER03_24010 [Bryobacteraceae bacterium]|nr:hypothetical protein [Bryobacteraceae bacterium]